MFFYDIGRVAVFCMGCIFLVPKAKTADAEIKPKVSSERAVFKEKDIKPLVENHPFYDIATLNVDKLLHESKAARQIQKDLEIQRAKFEKEMKAHEEIFSEWEKELINQQKDLKPEEFVSKRKEFDQKIAKVHQDVMKRREFLEGAFQQAMSKVQETIFRLVREKALREKYKIVVPHNFVIFQEEGLDITEDILNKLDMALPSISLKLH